MNIFILIILFWLLSEIAWTIAGFGSSSIFLPLVSQLMDFKNALILVAIYHIFWNFSRLLMFYHHVNKKILFLFWVPSIFFTALWATLTQHIDQNILKIALWVVLFSFASYSLFNPTWKIKVSNSFGIIWWTLSWFTAWLIGTGWVLRGAFMTLFQLPKEQYIATIASVALIVDFTRIPIYFKNGFLDVQYMILIPFLFITALVGSYIGKKLVHRIPEILFKKIILVAIMILSLYFIYQWIIL